METGKRRGADPAAGSASGGAQPAPKSGWLRFPRSPNQRRHQTAPISPSKLRWPSEYSNWRLYEVVLPLVAGPGLMFGLLSLAAVFGAKNQSLANALATVAGTGDLLVFAAFLVINVGAKFRSLEDEERLSSDVNAGEIRAGPIFVSGMMLLLSYTGLRLIMELVASPDQLRVRFLFGAASSIALLFVLLWLNHLIMKMHENLITKKIESSLRNVNYVR